MSNERLRFDEFEIDVQTRELWRSGAPVALRPQPAAVLLYLVQHAGELVTREQLQQHIWRDDVAVDFEHPLNSAVRQVRMALGERADEPRLVQTFPRRGYRLATSATPVQTAAPDVGPETVTPEVADGPGAIAPGAPLSCRKGAGVGHDVGSQGASGRS